MSRRRPAPGDREPPSRSTGPYSRQALPGHDPRRCSLQPRRSRSTRRLQPAPPSHTEDRQNPRTSLVRPPLPSEAVVLAGAVVAPAVDEPRACWSVPSARSLPLGDAGAGGRALGTAEPRPKRLLAVPSSPRLLCGRSSRDQTYWAVAPMVDVRLFGPVGRL